MLGLRACIGLGLALAGLILLCASLSELDVFPGARSTGSDGRQSLAGLAWAAVHCDSQSNAARPIPILRSDDLIELSVTFDTIENRHGHATACAVALGADEDSAVAIEAAAQPSRVALETASQSR